MQSRNFRLDRLLGKERQLSRNQVRALVAAGRLQVDGKNATSMSQQVNQFSRIELDGEVIQDTAPVYIMLNKTKGYVSATKDEIHPTVMDLIPRDNLGSLHIAGRLDFNTTGLLLLTNDGRWSRRISQPKEKVAKRYLVESLSPLRESAVAAFAKGIYLAHENITTRPAGLKIISEHKCEVTLYEGKYHQIKRMFASLGNAVEDLHRQAVGALELDPQLAPGESRHLTEDELSLPFQSLGDSRFNS